MKYQALFTFLLQVENKFEIVVCCKFLSGALRVNTITSRVAKTLGFSLSEFNLVKLNGYT